MHGCLRGGWACEVAPGGMCMVAPRGVWLLRGLVGGV